MARRRNADQCVLLQMAMEDQDRWDSHEDLILRIIPTSVALHPAPAMDRRWAGIRTRALGHPDEA